MSIDALNRLPWRGLQPYQIDDRANFVGREEEIRSVTSLIRSEALVVLYGASGTGKTSLLNAGVFPRLLGERFLPFRVRLPHGKGEPLTGEIYRQLLATAEKLNAETPSPNPDDTLWEYFNRIDSEIWSEKNEPLIPVMVLDQFEEIFTLGQATPEARRHSSEFLEQLSGLVEMREPVHVQEAKKEDPSVLKRFHFQSLAVRIVVSQREDFLPDLESLRGRFRGLQQNRFRLLPMDTDQARKVIGLGGHLLGPGAEEAILEFARKESGLLPNSRIDPKGAQTETEPGDLDGDRKIYSPALLSFYLHELSLRLATREGYDRSLRLALGNAKIPSIPDKKLSGLITAEMVRANRDLIFDSFYRRSLEGLPEAVAGFIEERLVTPNGKYRESVSEETWNEELRKLGVTEPETHARELETRRLLNRSVSRLELLHDVLVLPVWRSGEVRRAAVQGDLLRRERRRVRNLRGMLVLMALLLFISSFTTYRAVQGEVVLRQQKEESDRLKARYQTSSLLIESAFKENYTRKDIPDPRRTITQLNTNDVNRLLQIASGLAEEGRVITFEVVSRRITSQVENEFRPLEPSLQNTFSKYPETGGALPDHTNELLIEDLERIQTRLKKVLAGIDEIPHQFQ
jgi:hypothetical protein